VNWQDREHFFADEFLADEFCAWTSAGLEQSKMETRARVLFMEASRGSKGFSEKTALLHSPPGMLLGPATEVQPV